MLEIKNISKTINDKTIFKNISFKINKGEVVAIKGKSGSGKTTLLKCINKLENITDGEILFNNTNINEIDTIQLRRKIGLVFQEYNLFNHLTVLDNLILAPSLVQHEDRKNLIEKAYKLLNMVDLESKVNNYPDELSGGQQQRVAIIRTLMMNPELILLDEPTSALDKEMKNEVFKLIKKLVKEDRTIIIVSHEDEFIDKIADKIIEIK